MRCWRSVSQRAVGAKPVVLLSPPLDQHLGLQEGVEDFSVEKLIAELPVEGLYVSVLPGTSRFDVEGSNVKLLEPFSDNLCSELRAVVRTHELWRPSQSKELRETIENVVACELALDVDRQALPGVLVDQREHADGPSVVGAIEDKVVAPNVVPALWAMAYTGAVVQP